MIHSIVTRMPLTPTPTRVLDKRNKVSNLMLTTGSLAVEEIAIRAQAEKTKAAKKAGNQHIQKFGVITLANGRYRLAQRNVPGQRITAQISRLALALVDTYYICIRPMLWHL